MSFNTEKETVDAITRTDGTHRFAIDRKPDTCPACGNGIQPVFVAAYSGNTSSYEGRLEVVFRCPRGDCDRLFLSYYRTSRSSITTMMFFDRAGILATIDEISFPESMDKVTNEFQIIYNQSRVAEENGLQLIAGPGYRKALEFLVKDYIIKVKPELESKVKGQLLGDAIKNIDDVRIKACAERAAWLGNDETHYVRVFEDKDLEDLKNLIHTVVDWIDLTERSKEYEKGMTSSKKPSEKS